MMSVLLQIMRLVRTGTSFAEACIQIKNESEQQNCEVRKKQQISYEERAQMQRTGSCLGSLLLDNEHGWDTVSYMRQNGSL